ncbi:hypothetical protein TFLX_01830 [Thermoflexales bacterium]|nr:hypothetical protein TFLX_01830 [Thermoflexales bacterium]
MELDRYQKAYVPNKDHCLVQFGSPVPLTLVDLLCWRAVHQPGSLAYTFLIDGESEEINLTYAELNQRARAIGARLQRLGA